MHNRVVEKAFAASGEAATIIPRSKGVELCANKTEISSPKRRKLKQEKEKSLPESRKMKIIGKERSFEKKEIKIEKIPTNPLGQKCRSPQNLWEFQ